MKIQINTNDLQNMLKVSKGLELRKLEIDFQRGLLISANNDIKLIMNNLEAQINSAIDGEIIEPGQVVIPESTLKILESFKDGYITITNKCIIHGTKEIKYMSGLVDDFHRTTEDVTELLFETTEAELDHLLGVKYATRTSAARPNLEGINIYKNRFAATNGYYISVRESNHFHIYENIVMAPSVWKTLLKAVDKKSDDPVKVFWDNKKLIKFQFADFEVTGSVFDGDYFNIDKIIATDHEIKITLNTKKLLKSIRLMKKLKANKQLIKLCIDDLLKISSSDNYNTITDEIKITNFKGQPLEIWFNIDYFYDVMNQYKNETVNMEFSNNIGPMIVKSDKKVEFLLPVKPRTEV